MKRALAVLALALGAVVPLGAAPASAAGPTVAQLENAGWDCFPVPGLGMHCARSGALSGKGSAQSILYFNGPGGAFSGQELLMFTDRDLSTRPCHGHADGVWHDLGFAWACHHR